MQYLQIHIVKFKHGQELYKRALRKNTACAQYIGATVEHGAGAKQRIHQPDRNGQKHAICRGAYKLLRLFRHERERVFRRPNSVPRRVQSSRRRAQQNGRNGNRFGARPVKVDKLQARKPLTIKIKNNIKYSKSRIKPTLLFAPRQRRRTKRIANK